MLPLNASSLGFTDAISISGLGFLIVLIVLAGLMLFVKLLSSIISGASKKEKAENIDKISAPATEAPAPAVAPSAPVVSAPAPIEVAKAPVKELPYTPGYVTLDGVSEQDAAVVMAITSDKTGIPLERLCFKSIRRLNQEPELINIAEQDAAVIMAITSHRTGIALENLSFNSIKLVEE